MDRTLTTAGMKAFAGAARPRTACHLSATTTGYGAHQASTWVMGAEMKPSTFQVSDLINRPARRPPELSP
jgi:hypothetical protein